MSTTHAPHTNRKTLRYPALIPERGPELLIIGMFAAVAISASADAQANCTCPEPVVLGSVPEDGATAVPTDVRVALFTSACIEPTTATINDTALERDGQHFWTPKEELQPNTEYRVAFEVLESQASDSETITFSFTTGDGTNSPASPPPEIALERISSEMPQISADCLQVDSTTGCADTGDRYFYEFESTGSAHGWLIETQASDSHAEFDRIWPASCGEPRYSGYAFESGCFEVRAIDQSGRLSAPAEWCFDSPGSFDSLRDEQNTPNEEREDADGGCSSTKGDSDYDALFVALMLFAWVRRRSA